MCHGPQLKIVKPVHLHGQFLGMDCRLVEATCGRGVGIGRERWASGGENQKANRHLTIVHCLSLRRDNCVRAKALGFHF